MQGSLNKYIIRVIAFLVFKNFWWTVKSHFLEGLRPDRPRPEPATSSGRIRQRLAQGSREGDKENRPTAGRK